MEKLQVVTWPAKNPVSKLECESAGINNAFDPEVVFDQSRKLDTKI
jgi:hypothetical protein